jgi:hypothetical protein
LFLLPLHAVSPAAKAQDVAHLPVVATPSPGFPSYDAAIAGLKDGVRELGYVEGSTVEIEARWGPGKPETLPALAEELVRLNVKVIVALGRPAINAARLATTVLPIVAIDLESDPIAEGFIASAITVIGIYIGKNSFHVVGQDRRGAIVLWQKWSRGQIEARFASLPPCLIGMEACIGAHHLNRQLQTLGHQARLMPAKCECP